MWVSLGDGSVLLAMGFQFDEFGVHQKIIAMVRPKSRILEIGTGSGYMGEQLMIHGCSVVGVEIDKKIAPRYAICGDIEQSETQKKIHGKFDYILFADVLEHLKNPLIVLTELKKYLALGGQVIISVPNIAFVTNRLFLLQGRWIYSQYGIWDRTHLKYFTKELLTQMITSSGLTVKAISPAGNFTQLPVYMSTLYRLVGKQKWWRRLEQQITTWWPEGLAVQFLAVCEK